MSAFVQVNLAVNDNPNRIAPKIVTRAPQSTLSSQPATIAVLEWICGGGLLAVPPAQIDSGLRSEGWLMLNTLVDGLASAGMKVCVQLDTRLTAPGRLHPATHVVEVPSHNYRLPPTDELLPPGWADLASACDYVWIIAPEIEGQLPRIIERLQGGGHKLLNCHGDFLRNSCDKRLTAQCLTAAGIPHPSTRPLEQIDEAWLDASAATATGSSAHAAQAWEEGWIIKPAAGAGGSGQRGVTREQLLQAAWGSAAPAEYAGQLLESSRQLVQPWLPGRPASCSVIVDTFGKRHWLPVVSQDFLEPESTQAHQQASLDPAQALWSPPRYVGCTYPCRELPADPPHELLDAVLDALGAGAYGWVGIDLLYDARCRTWTVIEVNARCTSSLVGLAPAYRGKLVPDIFNLLNGTVDRLSASFKSNFNPFQFRIPSDMGERA